MPLTEFVSRNAEWYPGKTAIIFEGRKLSWRDFNRRINRVAGHLARVGIAKGDKVAILSRNCLEYPEIMFGAVKAGAVVVPISTMLQPETILLQLQDAMPKAIFAGNENLHRIGTDRSPEIRVVLDGVSEGWTAYADFIEEGSEEEPECILAAEDRYNIIYSSGTTGTPRESSTRIRRVCFLP